jgi:putative ABC transport system permease protein
MRVRLVGIAPNDAEVFPRDTWNVEGALPGPSEVLLGAKPASLMRADVGDVVTLETRTVSGAMNAMRFVVSGILTTGNPMVDNVGVFIDLSTADTLLNAQGKVTHIATRVVSRSRSEAYASTLEAQIPGTEARTWQSEVMPMIEAQAIRQTMLDVIGLALLGMAATGIANTVLMAAFERTREIGTLRSMGLQRSGVLAMFAIEGFWMGLVGGLIGIALSGSVCWYYSVNGIDLIALMSGKADAMDNVPVAAVLYLEFSVPTLLLALGVGVGVAVLASVYPAYSASRIAPADAVRSS